MAKALFGIKAPEWWRHLRYHKKTFWRKVRRKFKKLTFK